MPGDYQYSEDEMKLKINCLGYIYGASIEDYAECMARVFDTVMEVKKVAAITLIKEREYEYDYEQTKMVVELTGVLDFVIKENLITRAGMIFGRNDWAYPDWNARLQHICFELLRRDPIGAYVEILREIRYVRVRMKGTTSKDAFSALHKYLIEVLAPIKDRLEATKMITMTKTKVAGYHVGDRSIYRQIFTPMVRPNFMLTRYMILPPERGVSLDRYSVGDSQVEIYKMPTTAEYFYHLLPPEFKLPDEKYAILDEARMYMATHKPKTVEFVRSKHIREVFFNIGRDILRDVAEKKGMHMKSSELEQLANILTRYTAGLGVLEILMNDQRVQDIYLNSPIERQPILVFHADFEECRTNLVPTHEDAEAWATRLRIESGRPLDEANPVLDAEIDIPGGQARFAVITRSLSPEGLGFAIRRHRDKPWTLPLFIKSGMLDPLGAGLLSFLVDGSVSLLVAGGRGAGKTSMLAALMLELLPKVRIVTIEDSVTGDAGIVYQNGGEMKSGTVGGLIDSMMENYGGESMLGRDILTSNPKDVRVFAMDKNGKIALAPVSQFIRHRVDKPMYEVRTATGRKISVTCDHSLFTMGDDGSIKAVKSKELKAGDFLVTPRTLGFTDESTESVDLLKHLDRMDGLYVKGHGIAEVLHRKDALRHCVETGYTKSALQQWRRDGIVPTKVLRGLDFSAMDSGKLSVKARVQSKPLPMRIKLDRDLLSFLGLWLADGCYDKSSVIISAGCDEERELCRRIASRFGIEAKTHSDRFSLMLNSVVLKKIMREVLGFDGNAYTKRIPPWVFRLSKKQAGWLLGGLYSGDGCVSDKEIIMSLSSEQMLRDVQTLLLAHGIIMRIGGFKNKDKTWRSSISSLKSMRSFMENIELLPVKKRDRLRKLCSKTSTHDSTDVVPLPASLKEELSRSCKRFSRSDYITRGNHVGRERLKRLLEEIPDGKSELKETIKRIAESDIYWDRIVSIKPYSKKEYVYDFSVPGYENFVCNNILAHNTLELPVKQMRELQFNIEQLKSRSVITRVETEMPADEALRTALRLGDSALIVGEVRSVEAKALYEAMRIGALSNVVAGTIHGESAFGVYDRVVNDLGVPPTSFKATDVIPVCKTLRSADGMHRFRRMTEITEVRKDWESNPLKEGGFVNLMEYSGKLDKLKPSDTLVNGESEVLNRIASYVKEWSGDWSAVWDNIQLRAKIKQAMVEISDKIHRPELLEAEWVTLSNSKYHLIVEQLRKESGASEAAQVYDQWIQWFKAAAKAT
jgi:type IV secretory pathway ATPase VirB11/archaellum biosynthesis ATPase/intein/homing endonuclease